MRDKFVVVIWPESQYFMGLKHCHLINDDEGYNLYGSAAYFLKLILCLCTYCSKR